MGEERFSYIPVTLFGSVNFKCHFMDLDIFLALILSLFFFPGGVDGGTSCPMPDASAG